MKICKECRFYWPMKTCSRMGLTTDRVTGQQIPIMPLDCYSERDRSFSTVKCGPAGKFFEPRIQAGPPTGGSAVMKDPGSEILH